MIGNQAGQGAARRGPVLGVDGRTGQGDLSLFRPRVPRRGLVPKPDITPVVDVIDVDKIEENPKVEVIGVSVTSSSSSSSSAGEPVEIQQPAESRRDVFKRRLERLRRRFY